MGRGIMFRWVIAATCSLALLIGLSVIIVGVKAQPEIAVPKKHFQYVPSTQVTGTPAAPQILDKATLIIQQNNQCWIGVPGATCGPERTYV